MAQTDSVMLTVQQLPGKYIGQVNKKIDKYSHRISSKTEKTLTRLSRWEKKIQALKQANNIPLISKNTCNRETVQDILHHFENRIFKMVVFR